MPVFVKSITVFPIKSLDGVSIKASGFTKMGGLKNDREFALVDRDKKIINAKKYASIQKLRTSINLAERIITINTSNLNSEIFELHENNKQLNEWFSDYFSKPVTLISDSENGFPDDKEAFGPTVCSSESIKAIANWFGEKSLNNIRERFRCNIEIDGCSAFWEDQLTGKKGTEPFFKIGSVDFKAVNICQRCVVPTRHPITAEENNEFIKKFKKFRENELNPLASESQFIHFYRFSVNTKTINSQENKISIDDEVSHRLA